MEGGRRILEIGPGPTPLHNRGEFALEDNEEYIGLDYNNVFGTELWKTLKAEYGSRINMLRGDRIALPFAENTMDEIVMLGTAPAQEHQQYRTAIEEVDRVLKSRGIVRLGVLASSVQTYYDTWGIALQEKGYNFLPEETKQYDYSREVREKRRGLPPLEGGIPYIVISYRKP